MERFQLSLNETIIHIKPRATVTVFSSLFWIWPQNSSYDLSMYKPISIKMFDCNRVIPVRLNFAVKFQPFIMKFLCAEKYNRNLSDTEGYY
jgi:hypothetical protein